MTVRLFCHATAAHFGVSLFSLVFLRGGGRLEKSHRQHFYAAPRSSGPRVAVRRHMAVGSMRSRVVADLTRMIRTSSTRLRESEREEEAWRFAEEIFYFYYYYYYYLYNFLNGLIFFNVSTSFAWSYFKMNDVHQYIILKKNQIMPWLNPFDVAQQHENLFRMSSSGYEISMQIDLDLTLLSSHKSTNIL